MRLAVMPVPARAALVLVLAALVLASCGGTQRVPLRELTFEPERYVGKSVQTSGFVREFGPDEDALVLHYVVEDQDQNRVQLLPDEVAAPHVGQVVTVTGTFEFDEQTGRRLLVEELEAPGS